MCGGSDFCGGIFRAGVKFRGHSINSYWKMLYLSPRRPLKRQPRTARGGPLEESWELRAVESHNAILTWWDCLRPWTEKSISYALSDLSWGWYARLWILIFGCAHHHIIFMQHWHWVIISFPFWHKCLRTKCWIIISTRLKNATRQLYPSWSAWRRRIALRSRTSRSRSAWGIPSNRIRASAFVMRILIANIRSLIWERG